MTQKEIVLDAIQKLPDDVSLGQITHQLEFLSAAQSGLNQIDPGKNISHEGGDYFTADQLQDSATTLQTVFDGLAKQWKSLQGPSSTIGRLAMHPVHLDILKLGQPVIPLILRDLERQPCHWYVTLRSLVGSSPVPPEHAGDTAKMREAWLQWGRERNYI
jgi:hypothetical protein